MPVVLSIHGVAEPYWIHPGQIRSLRPESAAAADDHRDQRLPRERSAQAAYQRQASAERPAQPAVLASDLMTAPVVTLPSDSTLAEAWEVMIRRGFRHIPVTSVHGVLVGMVSDREVLHYAPELVLKGSSGQAAYRGLAEIVSPRLISATSVTEIRDIARAMVTESIHAVPILDALRRPIGILTTQDLLRAIAHHGPLELWT
jgi:acetoin utilization protein AcuB